MNVNPVEQANSAYAEVEVNPVAEQTKSTIVQRRSQKRPRINRNAAATALQQLRRCYFDKLPLEILAEVLSYVPSQSILAVARCSKTLCSAFVNNPSTAFIWRQARERCDPPVPDPTPNFTEASYAAFLFDGGRCEVCEKRTDEMYISFTLRGRVCKKHSCLVEWKTSKLLLVDPIVHSRYQDIKLWVPRLEEDHRATTVPRKSGTIRVRETDWLKAVDEYNKAALSSSTIDAYLREKQALADRLSIVQEHASALLEWRKGRAARVDIVKSLNNESAKIIAHREGWTSYDLLMTKSYGSLHRSNTAVLEAVTEEDYQAIQATVEEEVAKMKERSARRGYEAAYKKRRDDVEEHYKRLQSMKEKKVLPTLAEFRKLSIMKVMQAKSCDATSGIAADLKNSTFITALLEENLEKWREDARAALGTVLGYPAWKATSKTKLHPVDRVTAWFRCKRCHGAQKKGEDTPLDFIAACSHRCSYLDKRRRAKDNWSAQLFEPDTQAIQLVNQLLAISGLSAEDPDTGYFFENSGFMFVCLSCPSHLFMDFNTAIRHCKRHEGVNFSMEWHAVSIDSRHPFQSGTLAMVMGRKDTANDEMSQKVFCCRHCDLASRKESTGEEHLQATQDKGTAKINKQATHKRTVTFNGLVSHLKEKHGVVWIGDEDFFTYKPKST
ncbi:uncharacterized protein LAESUDRAFT_728854 [Laetiporus sulphureus 93-53]|uniref:F-box domain-containing protein n=1 Tax=Laetiporus sulphureus 93-53 TaxID=1314785 RepID=A0A165CZZ4_9APHY|nr:uncharacterized protein LAESUDRAFT_728854 [Laetiporus sulphureus 93-53]KZT03856.1 hypothetical protein LAESUDRAFT_728854 [Laetiporus sulphureus 93-53]